MTDAAERQRFRVQIERRCRGLYWWTLQREVITDRKPGSDNPEPLRTWFVAATGETFTRRGAIRAAQRAKRRVTAPRQVEEIENL